MTNKFLLLSLFVLCLWLANRTYAQTSPKDSVGIHEMSLEDLMKIPIQVSKSNLNIREVPSVISVITRDQILNMGARDLIDILNQVPGFTLGLDGLGLVGLGVRGNWAHEGKLLLLIDGQEANDLLFGTNHFGLHYDINNIDRIEIIRGPGSAIYGGYAELGVISIITRKGKDIRGIGVNGLYAGTSHASATKAVASFSLGNANDKIDYSLSGQYGQGLRSDDKAYTDIFGGTTDLSKNSRLRPFTLNGSFSAGGFSARVLIDKYQLETIDGFDAIFPKSDLQKFTYVITDAKYNWKVSDKLQITPRMNMRYGSPYNTSAESSFIYLVESRRLAPSINMNWTPSDKVSIVAGADSYFDHAKSNGPGTGYFVNLGGTNETSPLYDIGLFAQGVIKTGGFNITLGSRYDHHNLFGSAFSPRIGITKVFEKIHFKALYSRAFRAPAIEYLNYSPNIKPEKAGVAEIELGVKLNEQLWLTGNFFHMLIDGPIIFQPDTSIPIGGYYANQSKTGSMGFELSLQAKYSWGYVNANYAYYTAKDLNLQPTYLAPDNSQSLGLPSNRINMSGHIKIVYGLSLNPSVNLLGSRYAITTSDAGGAYVYTKLNSEFFANLFLRYSKDNFSIGFGAFDIFDQRQKFVQAYAAGHAPLPGVGREFSVRVGYKLDF